MARGKARARRFDVSPIEKFRHNNVRVAKYLYIVYIINIDKKGAYIEQDKNVWAILILT